MLDNLRTLLSRIRAIFQQASADRELDAEVQSHLDMLVQRFRSQGMSEEEARHAARRQFGGVAQLKEDLRDRRGLPHLEILWRDVRYALRQLRNAPAFTAAAVLTLALGIGANTAVFAVVDAVVFRPLPYPEPNRLVAFASWVTRGTPHPDVLSYPNFFDFRSGNRVFEDFVCYRDEEFSLSGHGEAIHVDGEIVSWDLFPLLRVQPELGRGFLPDEEKPGTNVAVLSHELWQSYFGGDRNVVGRPATINGRAFTIVGVAPPGFHFPIPNPSVQLWTTLAEDAIASEYHPLSEQRGARTLSVIARLKDGVTEDQARAQMDSIAAALAAQYPDENKNRKSTYILPELERLTGDTRQPMLVLLGAVFLLLLIACANIANLVLARSVERQRELALRAAMGASRSAVIRQLLTEGLVLGFLGSLAGVLLAVACLHIFVPLAADSIPRISLAIIDGRVLAFSIALAGFTSVLFSLSPVLQFARLDVVTSLKEGARNLAGGRERFRGVLVAGQITLGLMLLSAAGFLIAGFLQLERRDLGFRSDHVLTFNLDLPQGQYNLAKQIRFSDQLLERLRAVPGVLSAATGWPLPMQGNQVTVSFDIEERRAAVPDRPRSDMAIVTPGYFQTLGIPLLEGRDFTERDDTQALPVLVVNKAFADKFFPGEDVLGKRIEPGATNGGKTTLREIIGVVGNAKQSQGGLNPDPIYYFPYKQLSWTFGTIVLRTTVSPRSVESAARGVVSSLDRQIPVYQVRTMDELSAAAIASPRFLMLLLGSFAAIALLLVLIGLYGILAYSVNRRIPEIGMRMALGASRGVVLTMVLGRAMRLVLAGLLLGLAGAVGESYLLQTMLYGVFGVRPDRPGLLFLACGAILIASVMAAYLPARRAASVDVMQALRTE
jgi:predicted permease